MLPNSIWDHPKDPYTTIDCTFLSRSDSGDGSGGRDSGGDSSDSTATISDLCADVLSDSSTNSSSIASLSPRACMTEASVLGMHHEEPSGTLVSPFDSPLEGIRLFVARIPHSVDTDAFRAYFEQFGVVLDAYLPVHKGSGGHRGIGFLTYATREDAEVVLKCQHHVQGNQLAVDVATKRT